MSRPAILENHLRFIRASPYESLWFTTFIFMPACRRPLPGTYILEPEVQLKVPEDLRVIVIDTTWMGEGNFWMRRILLIDSKEETTQLGYAGCRDLSRKLFLHIKESQKVVLANVQTTGNQVLSLQLLLFDEEWMKPQREYDESSYGTISYQTE